MTSRLPQFPPDAWGGVLPDPEIVEDWYRQGRREGWRNGALMTAAVMVLCAGIGALAWFG